MVKQNNKRSGTSLTIPAHTSPEIQATPPWPPAQGQQRHYNISPQVAAWWYTEDAVVAVVAVAVAAAVAVAGAGVGDEAGLTLTKMCPW